jgi:uncharacterized protein
LAKPSGATCNLGCSYCFFLDKELLYPGGTFRMSEETLDRYIRQLIETHRSSQVTVAWQGGEPTLMGVDFYRKAIALQDKYRRPGMTFENTLQTNGTLLNDEWCAFLKQHGFLVGLSIDGPAHLHDAYRVDKGGKPTFEAVMRGLRLLQQHGVDYNLLVTVNRINADYPREVYRFLRDVARTDWIQLIPVVERMNPDGGNLRQQGDEVSSRSVLPEQFGRFLIGVFDEWVHHDVGKVYVQTFEAAVRSWLGMPTGMCIFDKTCGYGLALEHTGDLYACDHFVEPEYLLGNLTDAHMAELVGSARQYTFGQDKHTSLPRYCRECPVLFACHGECPKNRFIKTPDGEPGLNYLCAGYKAFFQRADEPLRLIAGLMRRERSAAEAMPLLAKRQEALWDAYERAGPDDTCPCRSRMPFKHCHGWKKPTGRPVMGPESPRPPVRGAVTISTDGDARARQARGSPTGSS